MKHPFTKLGLLVGVLYWVTDSSIHYLVLSERPFTIIPSDIDELWMRTLIFIVLVFFGRYVDYAKLKSERDLRGSVNQFKSLVESSPDIVWRINTDGVITYMSPSVKQVLGFEPDEFIGRNFDQQFDDRESRHKALMILSQRLRGDLGHGPVVYELQYTHRNGTSITAEIRSAPILGEDGELLEEQGISRDITEHSRLKEELERMATLESIGILAAGIAQDLDHSLTSNLDDISAARTFDDPVERDKKLEAAAEDLLKLKDLTFQLLNVAKSGLPTLRVSEIGEIIRQAVESALSDSIHDCTCAISDELSPVEIDEAQISQVISNLIVNAQDATPAGGTINVTVSMSELDTEQDIPLDPGSYVKISVQDSGSGIAEKDHQRVFEPFFTTRPAANGLGLATANAIIKKHKGHMSMSSEIGVGARFDIYLPACAKESLNQQEPG
jgi:PAS domain S-box-containing protein